MLAWFKQRKPTTTFAFWIDIENLTENCKLSGNLATIQTNKIL